MELSHQPSTPRTSSHGKPMAIASLMSPAEEPVDSFERGVPSISRAQQKIAQPDAKRPPSPPISPYTPVVNQPATETATVPAHIDTSSDPVVVTDASPGTSSQPLFGVISPASRQTIDNHLRQNLIENPAGSFPSIEAYYDVAYFVECMMPSYLKNPAEWLKREREQLLKDRHARASAKPRVVKAIAPRSSITVTTRTDPLQSALAPRHSGRVDKKKTTSTSRATVPQSSALPQSSARSHSSNQQPSSAPQPSRNRPVAATKEDKQYLSIPDYCPSIDSLKNRVKGEKDLELKVEWRGANSALDLSNDPLRHLLHYSELKVASHLRLDCATYLTSKRRIFYRRLQFYHWGKEFRKTHAQICCKIDVNKASKLHTAFEEVGWFQPEWMKGLPNVPDLDA